ncbi:MAG: TIGR03905 family TSCPD domain-containing protein [Parabacteroides sp.]
MKQQITYVPQGGVCSKLMTVDVEDGVIRQAVVIGGCHGNGQGLCALLKGMRVEEAILRMEGIDCHGRGTSCPDQMAQALKQAL